MKKTSLIILAIFCAVVFSACTMSASTPPPVTATTNLSEIARQATETAIAKTPKAGETQAPEGTQETEAEATDTESESDAPEPTNTPKPTASAEDEAEETSEPVAEYPVPDSYTLREGEFIFCLARRFNILPEDLQVYNGIGEGTLLYPGDTIQIPPDPRPFIGNRALVSHPTTYSVVFGDSLYSIACKYGDVDPRAIAAANDLDVNQALTPGTVLQIP